MTSSGRIAAVGLGAATVGALLALLSLPPGSPSSFVQRAKATRAGGVQTPPAPSENVAPPPRFNLGQPALQLVPGQPGYNPSKLASIVGVREIFDQEPRHESWAGPVERFIRSELTAHLPRSLPDLRLKGIECRTAVCRVEWEEMSGSVQSVNRVLREVLPGATSGWSPDRNEYVVTFQGGEFFGDVPLNDPAATIARIQRHRAYWSNLKERGRVHGRDAGAK